ncbi:MAG TPA: hypothetical protein VHY09_15880 [Candidatus Methylacidiphilales bacterium]|jgi:hypothetical protein|nr:hypothetical protein [Candidatus Methylacidiphilales bacterium]
MELPPRPAVPAQAERWTSLWVIALLSLIGQLWVCQFFAQDPVTHGFGETVPFSEDVNPSKLWTLAYTFPPTGTFQVLNWLGLPYLPQALNPLSLAAALMSPWMFFTTYVPILSTLALLAMAAFLRELEISRPAALFGAVIYAWQGDVLSFIYPGHYGYLTSWPFYALGAWGALRASRTGRWPYAVIGGVCCGTMVGLLTNADRGGIASMLVGALFLAPLLRQGIKFGPMSVRERPLLTGGSLVLVGSIIFSSGLTTPNPFVHWTILVIGLIAIMAGLRLLLRDTTLRHFFLCVAVAGIVALAPLSALFKGNINSVTLGGTTNRDDTYKMVSQYSLGPAETLTYLVPGFFGWHLHSEEEGLYWGWIGEWPDWETKHQGQPNLNLAISTCGTIATLLAMMGALVILPGRMLGPDRLNDRQRFFARVLLALGLMSLVLSWGQFTGPLYRFLFDNLPLMDKWRDPLKWLEMLNFALMPLAAIGLDHLIGTLAPEGQSRRRFVVFVLLVLAALAVGVFATYALGEVARRHFVAEGIDPRIVATMIDTMHSSLFRAMLLAVLLIAVPFALWHADSLRRRTVVNPWLQRRWEGMLRAGNLPLTLALALAGLSVVQLDWVAGQFIQAWPIRSLVQSNPLLDALRHEGDRVRCSVTVNDPTLNFMLQNQFAAMDISCLDISAASRYPVDLNTFFHTFDNDHAPLWFLAGVKNLVVPEAGLADLRQRPEVMANIERVDGYTIAPTPSPDVPSHAFIVLKDCLAKATLVPDSEVLDRSDLLKRLIDPHWQPRESVLLSLAGPDEHDPALRGDLPSPDAIAFPPPSATRADVDRVDLEKYTPTEINLNVESTRNAFLLINDYYDHDWQAQVNGQDAPLLRADFVMRAVAVPAGMSTVTMRYVAHYGPLPVVAVSLFSDGAMLAAWIVALLALRRDKSTQP